MICVRGRCGRESSRRSKPYGAASTLLPRGGIRHAARNAWDDSRQRIRVVGSRREESLRLLSGCAVRSAWRTRTQITNASELRVSTRCPNLARTAFHVHLAAELHSHTTPLLPARWRGLAPLEQLLPANRGLWFENRVGTGGWGVLRSATYGAVTAKEGKIALQREDRVAHGAARMTECLAEERFFHGSVRSAESRCPTRRSVCPSIHSGHPEHLGEVRRTPTTVTGFSLIAPPSSAPSSGTAGT